MRRREFLGLGSIGLVGLAGLPSGCGSLSSLGASRDSQHPRTGRAVPSVAPRPHPYANVLEPRPSRRPDASGQITLVQREADVDILAGRTTRIWGYDGVFPGPTIEARRGSPLRVTVRNELPLPTSTHLHGGVQTPESDGGPHDLVLPAGFSRRALEASARATAANSGHAGGSGHGAHGMPWRVHDQEFAYAYPMLQPAALLWYHDHRMDYSAPQVWRGLAGGFVVRDDAEDALELPRDDHEFVLALTDRSFGADGELLYPALDPTLTRRAGVEDAYMDGVLGDVMLVNGTPSPTILVPRGLIRLRLLNACNARPLRLALTPEAPATLIGTDSGLLRAPVRLRGPIELVPGERADVVLDLRSVEIGSAVELVNEADPMLRQIARLRVDRPSRQRHRVPDVLVPDFETLDESSAVASRLLDFRLTDGRWTVNARPYAPHETLGSVRLGAVERWVLTSDLNHPVHVHLGHFQVLRRGGRAIQAARRGWKDTVAVGPYETVEVLVRFTHFTGRYMVHCHNLEHEDMGMMANIDVVP